MKKFQIISHKILVIAFTVITLALCSCEPTVPNAPTGVSATDGDYADKIVVTWSASQSNLFIPADVYYKVYRSNSEWISLGVFFQLPEEVSGTSYSDHTVQKGNMYYYKVKAFSSNNTGSEYSNFDEGFADDPGFYSPKHVSATDGTLGEMIAVGWDEVPEAVSYRVYRSEIMNGVYSQICPDIVEPFYIDSAIEIETDYYYKITAVNSENQESDFSEAVLGSASRKLEMVSEVDMLQQVMTIAWKLISLEFFNMRKEAREVEETLPEPEVIPVLPNADEMFQYVSDVCINDHRRPGTNFGLMAEDYIYNKFIEFGLINVKKEPVEMTSGRWYCDNWQLLIEQGSSTIDFPCFYSVNTGHTGPEGVSGEMVWIGDEGTPEAFSQVDVSGKIVVAECPFAVLPLGTVLLICDDAYYKSDPLNEFEQDTSLVLIFARSNYPPQFPGMEKSEDSVYWLAQEAGAKALVLILKGHPGDVNTHWGSYDSLMKPMPCLFVSSYEAERIQQLAENNLPATVIEEGGIEPGVFHNISGDLPGQSDETILVSTHHDAPFKGATEDGTGVASVMAQAKSWSQIPEGMRKKSLKFIITGGHFYAGLGSHEFALEHRDEIIRYGIVDINLEHLGAKRVEDNNGDLEIVDGKHALSIIFANDDSTAIATSMRMCKRYDVPYTIVTPGWFLGDVPPGEAGHYHIETGINYIHWIGMPQYLLCADDTLDKVDKDMLYQENLGVAHMIGTYMELPER